MSGGLCSLWISCARGLDKKTRRAVSRDYTRYILFVGGQASLRFTVVGKSVLTRDRQAWLCNPRPKQLEVGCTACPTRHRSAGLDCIPTLQSVRTARSSRTPGLFACRWPRCTSTPRGAIQGFDPVSVATTIALSLWVDCGAGNPNADSQFPARRRGWNWHRTQNSMEGTQKVNVVRFSGGGHCREDSRPAGDQSDCAVASDRYDELSVARSPLLKLPAQ